MKTHYNIAWLSARRNYESIPTLRRGTINLDYLFEIPHIVLETSDIGTVSEQ